MIQENARVLIETHLQELLLESIACWEQYRSISKKKPSLVPVYLDKFILVLRSIKHALLILREENVAILEHNPHYGKKNNLRKKE